VTATVLPRRSCLKGLIGLIAAPAVVRAESRMPIVVWRPIFRVKRIYVSPEPYPTSISSVGGMT
jgi:hypothetical protein